MAYYVNGTLISGANTLPKMTMAEYLALPVGERPTYWECTDKDYEEISAENVTYGSGTVKSALDGLASTIVAEDFSTTKSIGANSNGSFTINNFTKTGYTLGSITCETSHLGIFVAYTGLSGTTGYFSILNPTDVARTDEPIRIHVLWVKS